MLGRPDSILTRTNTLIKAIVLCHPQSKDLISKRTFNSSFVTPIRIACGTTKPPRVDYYESNDFFPTYASWNSALFETSVILTVWEHAEHLIGDDHVAILHTDIVSHFKSGETWRKLHKSLTAEPNRPIGLTVSSSYQGMWDEWLVPDNAPFVPKLDPMRIHAFDNGLHVWDFIKTYDQDIYDWAMDTNPKLIYSHQFACTRAMFDKLGNKLYSIASRLRLSDIGFWTPHMFERLIALYLAKLGQPLLTTAFWHHSSSGTFGPGEFSLYGPRALKYYRVCTRWNEAMANNHVSELETPLLKIQRT